MRNLSIILAGALIAAAIMITHHWRIIPLGAVNNGISAALRVDQWTGDARVAL